MGTGQSVYESWGLLTTLGERGKDLQDVASGVMHASLIFVRLISMGKDKLLIYGQITHHAYATHVILSKCDTQDETLP